MKTEQYNEVFTIVTYKDEEENKNITLIMVGNNAIMKCENEEEAKKAIEEKSWELIINTASLVAYKTTKKVIEEFNEQKKEENNEN